MRFGLVLPRGDARVAAEAARAAEHHGWDGFFVYEPVWGVDAWVSLTAAAMVTEKIRLGTMISPLSRMKPWKVASETATLDHLSEGRVTLSVGLGAPDAGFEAFGEETDRKKRARLLDESLDILTGLWQGQPFSYDGRHYKVKPTDFPPPPSPVQRPRIPIWVVGAWRYERSMARALRYDGLLPNVIPPGEGARGPNLDEFREIAAAVREQVQDRPYDIVAEGTTPADPAAAWEQVAPWAEAGATWWIEALWHLGEKNFERHLHERLSAGPPRSS